MKLKWKKIKGFDNYLITNHGEVLNTKTSQFLKGSDNAIYARKLGIKLRPQTKLMAVCLSKNGSSWTKSLAKLVLKHFRRKDIPTEISLHLDLDGDNNKITNLKWANRSDAIRYKHTMNNKKRGVYRFNGKGNKRWRVNFVNKYGENKNFGYFRTKSQAEEAFFYSYQKEFGFYPYIRG